MTDTKGGKQAAARYARLRREILEYVRSHPGCTANQIVAALCCDRGMKNHGLTPRKVGFFIPRNLKGEVTFKVDPVTGKRIYLPVD